MIRIAIACAALAGATGCTGTTPPEPVPGVECNSTNLGSLIGKPQSADIVEEAKRLSGAKTVRFLTPDMMVTQEFRADRLNLHLGTDGNIGSARCG